jgi:hypothetical protein
MTDKSAELSAPSNAECLVPGSPRRLTHGGLSSNPAVRMVAANGRIGALPPFAFASPIAR